MSSSSTDLFNNICNAGGHSVRNSYEDQSNENPDASIITVQSHGKIVSRKIYFVPWTANSDESLCSKSIKNFVSVAINKAVEEKCHSIALPAIGCGRYECSISLVADSMINEAYRQLQSNKLSITFVILPSRKDIFDEFRKHRDLLEMPSFSREERKIKTIFQKGTIEVVMNDITKQKVLKNENIIF